MSPPSALAKRWRKIKKRCSSFSSSDKLVRSKSLTERDVSNEEEDDEDDEVTLQDKYLSVGPRDASRFQGLRHKIVQLKDSTLKKRRSTDNLTSWWQFHETSGGTGVRRSDSVKEVVSDEPDKGGFIVANPQQGGRVKSAVISATNPYCTNARAPRAPQEKRISVDWSSPSPSPPASDHSAEFSPGRKDTSYSSHLTFYQDQDSGYDGFCPEKSIYSTGSSDTGSVLSSEGSDKVGYHSKADYVIYGRTPGRPRPQPIYEKHEDYSKPATGAISHYGTVSPRAHIAQATVINLVKTTQPGQRDDGPPPLPPRPSSIKEEENQAPPPPKPKPRSKMITQTTTSLPRRRTDFREKGRRRGSCYDAADGEKKDEEESSLPYESDDKAGESSKFCTLPRHKKNQTYSIQTVTFQKGPGHKSLGFSIVGGKDSPKGSIGIYVKSIFPNGQALDILREGDEIFSVNGRSVAGLAHHEAIGIFKEIKVGSLQVTIGRREVKKKLVRIEVEQH